MKTNVRDTSLEAYYLDVLPNINDRQKAILKIFTENPIMTFTNLELSDELGWDINSVTPRTYELRGKDKRFPMDEPVLVEVGRRQSVRYKMRKYSLSNEPVLSKRKHIAMQLNPHWRPGGFKID